MNHCIVKTNLGYHDFQIGQIIESLSEHTFFWKYAGTHQECSTVLHQGHILTVVDTNDPVLLFFLSEDGQILAKMKMYCVTWEFRVL